MTHFLPYQQRNNQKLFPMENCYQYIKNFHFYYYFFLYLNTNHKKLSNIWRKLKTINWMKIYNYGETSTFYCIIWRFNGKFSFFLYYLLYQFNTFMVLSEINSLVASFSQQKMKKLLYYNQLKPTRRKVFLRVHWRWENLCVAVSFCRISSWAFKWSLTLFPNRFFLRKSSKAKRK